MSVQSSLFVCSWVVGQTVFFPPVCRDWLGVESTASCGSPHTRGPHLFSDGQSKLLRWPFFFFCRRCHHLANDIFLLTVPLFKMRTKSKLAIFTVRQIRGDPRQASSPLVSRVQISTIGKTYILSAAYPKYRTYPYFKLWSEIVNSYAILQIMHFSFKQLYCLDATTNPIFKEHFKGRRGWNVQNEQHPKKT